MFSKLKSMVTVSIVALALSITPAFARTVIKLPHSLDVKHPVHIAMLKMAKEVKEKTKGQIIIKIYPNGVMGSERETVELLQNNAVGMVKLSSLTLENFVPVVTTVDLPYIFKNEAQFNKFMNNKVGQEVLDEITAAKKGFTGLGYFSAGSRNFYTKKAINTPADLKGMKVRVIGSDAAVTMMKMLHASPTPLPWGEIYTSLQQGIVDAAENNIPAFYTSRHYEVAKVFTWDEHQFSPDVILINTKLWNKLSNTNKAILKTAIQHATAFETALFAKQTKDLQAKAAKKGVKFVHPNKAPFVTALKPMIAQYAKKGKNYAKIIKDIQNIK